jgi:uncharacterized membrane protein SirB2
MAAYYLQLRWLHIACAILSISLFTVRGALMMAGSPKVHAAVLRYSSYTIDTTLLMVALVLTTVIHQYPFATGWLTMKLCLLVAYVVLGSIALKRGSTLRVRTFAYVAALVTVMFLVSVARAHHPLGIFAPMFADATQAGAA